MKFILSGKVDISKLYVSSTMLQISHDRVKFVGMFTEDKYSERLKNVRLYFVEFIYCHSITKDGGRKWNEGDEAYQLSNVLI